MFVSLLIESNSKEFTENLGISFSKTLSGVETITLYGELGSGKTTFVRGIAKGLSVKDPKVVTSPTYNIMNLYKGKFDIYHWDMYRINSEDELYNTGFFDYIGKGITLIEWSENIKEFIPKEYSTIEIHITHNGENGRTFKFFELGIF